MDARARRRTAVAVAVVLALLPGCGLFGPDHDAALIGDSITDQSRQRFRNALSDDFRLDIRAVPGLRIGEQLEAARAAVAEQPDAVVVNLGTNDVLQDTPLSESVTNMDELLGIVEPVPCRYVVTINEAMVSTEGEDLPARARQLNDELRRLADEHGAEVIDWAAAVDEYLAAGEPDGPLTVDTVHPTRMGERKLARLYEDALDGCDLAPI